MKVRRAPLKCSALCLLALLPAYFPGVATRPVLSEGGRPEARVVKRLRRIPLPVDITSVRVRDEVFELGQPFSGEDDWFKGLAVGLENNSGVVITYIGGGFLFPWPAGLQGAGKRAPLYHSFMYGRHPEAPAEVRLSKQPISVGPGETFTATISNDDYESIRRRLGELGYPASIREMALNIEEVYFADGSSWVAGSWKK